jgi:DNA-directed RNA polymerase specialized sigma24 family protein
MPAASARDWRPSQESLDRLLAALAPDRERAGQKYQQIRASLERFFRWRGVAAYEDLADDTIDRVMKRLAEGEQIRAGDPALYFYGVARNVLREHWVEAARLAAMTGQLKVEPGHDPGQAETETLDAERRHTCLDRCLETLLPETRSLLLRYHRDDQDGNSQNRRALANELAIGLNALRIRVHRIRTRLEACVRGCLDLVPAIGSATSSHLSEREEQR